MRMYVITDYQFDFVEGSLGFEEAKLLDEGILARGQAVQAEGGVIVETDDTHDKKYLSTREGIALPIKHTIFGTPGWEVYGKTGVWLRSFPHIIIMKTTFGCPPDKMLMLPDGIDEIEFAGVLSNVCVISNVCCFQARYPNAQIIVHRNLVASPNKELHEKTLAVLEGLQVKVVD